jgi:importin-9
MAVAAIGQQDWPEDWPELLPLLLKLIGDQNNGNGGI